MLSVPTSMSLEFSLYKQASHKEKFTKNQPDRKKKKSPKIFLSLSLCSAPFYKVMVPTVDTVRYNFLVNALICGQNPVLLTGPVGTGKTSVAQSVLQGLDPSKWTMLTINMSSQVPTDSQNSLSMINVTICLGVSLTMRPSISCVLVLSLSQTVLILTLNLTHSET